MKEIGCNAACDSLKLSLDLAYSVCHNFAGAQAKIACGNTTTINDSTIKVLFVLKRLSRVGHKQQINFYLY